MSNRKQPQRLPPPIMHGGEAIDSEPVLRETDGETGVVLWKTVRSVRLWAGLTGPERSAAYEPRARLARLELIDRSEVPPPIEDALGRAAAVLQGRARASAVGKACREVAEWAAEEGKYGTAIEFMQAAALAVPADAELAHETARLARTAAEYQRAETWYREAIARARRARHWREFSRSYIGLGKVFILRGAYPQASRSLIRGLRAARRFSIRDLVAAAAHELVVVGFKTDRAADVARYARLAIEAYGPGHPRLPALAHDIGMFLLNSGYFDAARRILTSTPADYGSRTDQLARAAALVRLAGAIGDRAMYSDALSHAQTLLGDASVGPGAVQAYLAIARGADTIGDTSRAVEAATIGRDLAVARGEARAQFSAESLLESIRNRTTAEAAITGRVDAPAPLLHLIDEIEQAMAIDHAAG